VCLFFWGQAELEQLLSGFDSHQKPLVTSGLSDVLAIAAAQRDALAPPGAPGVSDPLTLEDALHPQLEALGFHEAFTAALAQAFFDVACAPPAPAPPLPASAAAQILPGGASLLDLRPRGRAPAAGGRGAATIELGGGLQASLPTLPAVADDSGGVGSSTDLMSQGLWAPPPPAPPAGSASLPAATAPAAAAAAAGPSACPGQLQQVRDSRKRLLVPHALARAR
jgi:hypothetical protein